MFNEDANYRRVQDHFHCTGKYRAAAHRSCNLRYKRPKEIPAFIYNGSNYDYHLIIKELAEEFKGQLECLGENAEKYITFYVPIQKQNENSTTITYKIKFIDSIGFVANSLSILADDLVERLYKSKCENCAPGLEDPAFKDNTLTFKCLDCNKNYKTEFDEGLTKRFQNTYRFCDGGINKFCHMLWKGVYPYEYMDNWERLNETSLPEK